MTQFAEVVVHRPLDQTYTYHIPFQLEGLIQPGHMVKIPFRTAFESGIVIHVTEVEPDFATKPIAARLDPKPIVTESQIQLAQWIAENTLTPIGLCVWVMLPPGITQKSDHLYELLEHDYEGSTPTEKQIISLLKRRGQLSGEQIKRAVTAKTWERTIKKLVEQKFIRAEPILSPPKVRPKTLKTVGLSLDPNDIPKIALQLGRESKRANVLEVLWQHPERRMHRQDLRDAAGCSDSVIKTLLDNGDLEINPDDKLVELLLYDGLVRDRILELRGAEPYLNILQYLAEQEGSIFASELMQHTGATSQQLEKLHDEDLITLGESEIWRDSISERTFAPTTPPHLTPDQAEAWGQIQAHMEQPCGEAFLLHGVTGSGKTEVYMHAVQHAIDQGRSAIVMVPEIALTSQMVQRFVARFPGQVALVHSTLSAGERYDTWRRARQGKIKVVIGARSALFTHLPDIGLIVLDEEHDDSYKPSPPIPPPYYHARETAIRYMQINNGTVILGSATPDVVSYHRALRGEYRLLHLQDRILAHRNTVEAQTQALHIDHANYQPLNGSDATYTSLPPVKVVDMRQELRMGHTSVFSRVLITELHRILEQQQQAILFLNRRGTATYVFCRDCGYIAKCERCETPLTFHHAKSALVCHQCGHQQANPKVCPDCQSHRIKYFGRGTEQIEHILKEEFADAKVLRWDQDTASARGAHRQIYEAFANREADILVGTQMIAKGLDLPLVTLVGIISGDTALGLPDFRANENSFQLLTQVAGRAGRGLLGGRVILQTYQPEHYAIQAAAHHDYIGFYEKEIGYRTALHYPPFTRITRILFKDRVAGQVQQDAEKAALWLKKHIQYHKLDASLIGPAPCFFQKIADVYRWQILVRCDDPFAIFKDFKLQPNWTLDIDPVDML